MSKKLWLIVLIILSTTLVSSWLALHYGLRPKPLRILRPTVFANKAQIGAVIYRRFFKDFQTKPLIVLGINSSIKNSQSVWEGFLKVAFHNKTRWDYIYLSKDWFRSNLNWRDQKKVLKIGSIGWIDIKENLEQGKRILLILDTRKLDFKDEKFFKRMQAVSQKKIIIGMEIFVVKKNDEHLISCENNFDPSFFLNSAGCASLQISRSYYRKKLDPQRITAAMSRYINDYHYLFISH